MSNYLNVEMSPSLYFNDEEITNNQCYNELNSSEQRDIFYATSNLNTFYDKMYSYYYQGGMRNIMLNIVLNMSILVTTNLFILYTFAFINWNDIIVNCKYNHSECSSLTDFISYDNKISPLILIYLLITITYSIIYLYTNICQLYYYQYIKSFYKNVLKIDNEYLNIIKWENVMDKIKNVHDSKIIVIERCHTSFQEIDQYSVITRITQYNNIVISLINSNILFKNTDISKNILYTRYIENITKYLIINKFIDTTYLNVSMETKINKLKKYLIVIILVDLLLLPFIFLFMLTYYVLKKLKGY